MLSKSLVVTLLALGAPLGAPAQVANDNIEARRVLAEEEVVVSTTTGCTVQRACVDERLTGQCIEYHNDQWFEFRPRVAGTYYVNVGQQRCRDVRGVQLVVLTGTPCQPATYRVLSCVSFGTQDDLFVPLLHLQAGQPYLLNIDGYLKDFCGFTIQVSRQARGLPVPPPTPPPATPPTSSRLVTLTWEVADSLPGVRQCRVLRREEHALRQRELATVPLVGSTLGRRSATYTYTDTLPAAGRYQYQVVTESADHTPPVLLRQQWVSYSLLAPVYPGQVRGSGSFVELPLTKYAPGTYVTISITRPEQGPLLRRFALTITAAPSPQGRVYAQHWRDAGVRQVEVTIEARPPHGTTSRERFLLPL